VALIHLKKLCSRAVDDPIHWNFDRTEVIADGIVHAPGVSFGLVGVTALFLVSATSTTVDTSVVTIYAVGLLTMLVLSATYNLWPVSPRKWLLRRFDQSAIYLLIAATYTPFLSQLNDASFATKYLMGVWGVAFAGIILKVNYPGRFDKLSIALYLAMGWSGAMAYDKAAAYSKLDFSTYRRRRCPLCGWRPLPFVAASAFSECNMAWLCDSRCKLPFHCGGRSCYRINCFRSKRTSEVATVIPNFFHCGS
jgi:hemolysin III